MLIQFKSKSIAYLMKTAMVAMILMLTVIPIFLLLLSAETQWVLLATLLWGFGSIMIFYPFIRYVYPHLISKVGVYLLTSILIIISVWFNIVMITLLLPYDYIYYAFFNATISHISLFGSIYLTFVDFVLSHFILITTIEFYREERLF